MFLCITVLFGEVHSHLSVFHSDFKKVPQASVFITANNRGTSRTLFFLYHTASLIKSDSKTQHLIFDLLADITSRHQYLQMQEYKTEHLLFLHDMRVPTTNNTSERCLRDYKRKQTFAMTFRSLESIEELCHSKGVLRGV